MLRNDQHIKLRFTRVPQASYGKGPDYSLAIFPISVSLLHFSMKFGNELEDNQYDNLK